VNRHSFERDRGARHRKTLRPRPSISGIVNGSRPTCTIRSTS
jgi:hypothetical protein